MQATEFETKLESQAEARFGGFVANLVGDRVFVHAVAWKGPQPRLVLHPGSKGYRDWRELLDAAPRHSTTIRFVGDPEAAHNDEDQWLTHRPSALLT